ncbi:hypothetical protein ABFS82_13G037400 [Erythranthe guttata]|nr:PREDICTED: uncharacterized protein LOC105953783 [Erythranthe guttata]|eukprot:XP_012832916.1 PREDICTED: uncharacterized protein LOC105953783 [Erythranthe guttata]
MSNPPRDGGGGGGDGNKNNESDKTVAKTAGFVVFSGIAMSILKAIISPFNNSNQCHTSKMEPLNDSTQIGKTRAQPPPPCCKSSSPPPPLQAPPLQKPVTIPVEQNVTESTAKTVKIVKGDTLWGLSREYGVSIEAIKEANGLSGDTIYAGKKLVIP